MRIVLCEEPSAESRAVDGVLRQLGHATVGHVADAAKLPAEVRRLSPDAVVLATHSPTAGQLQALAVVTQTTPCPILVFSDDPDRALIVAAVRSGASAYVVGPLTAARVAPVLDAAVARFEQLQSVRSEAEIAKTQLHERKLVERAKGILMKSRKLSEEDAYHAMRKQAMDRKIKLTDVARQIIAVADLLG